MTGGPVLLVDDDPDWLEVSRIVLASAGYDVVCFDQPDDAMRAAEQQAPSLVITDMMMGSLDDGLQLARRFKTHPRLAEVPVLLVTGLVRELGLDIVPRGARELEAMYADGFVQKPTSPEALLREVRRLLGERSIREARSGTYTESR